MGKGIVTWQKNSQMQPFLAPIKMRPSFVPVIVTMQAPSVGTAKSGSGKSFQTLDPHRHTEGEKKDKFVTNTESEYPIEYNTAARRPFLISFNTDSLFKLPYVRRTALIRKRLTSLFVLYPYNNDTSFFYNTKLTNYLSPKHYDPCVYLPTLLKIIRTQVCCRVKDKNHLSLVTKRTESVESMNSTSHSGA